MGWRNDTMAKQYPLYGQPSWQECRRLGVDSNACLLNVKAFLLAEATGEFRVPKKGEWFLSGAVPEAYKAGYKQRMTTKFNIVRLVRRLPPCR
jgi:hypothetical protein